MLGMDLLADTGRLWGMRDRSPLRALACAGDAKTVTKLLVDLGF
jgi:hypothetical protein